MRNKITIQPLQESDIDQIVSAFKNIGWHKPRSIYDDYLKEQSEGLRTIIIASENGQFCGYVTIKYMSRYSFFSENNIPEISDLNVLPCYQNKGIGTDLLDACEAIIKERGYTQVGLGVGMTADYGSAQRLYVRLGYVPDGNGLHYKNKPVHYNDKVDVDDDLVLYLSKTLSIKKS